MVIQGIVLDIVLVFANLVVFDKYLLFGSTPFFADGYGDKGRLLNYPWREHIRAFVVDDANAIDKRPNVPGFGRVACQKAELFEVGRVHVDGDLTKDEGEPNAAEGLADQAEVGGA
jgi:hypothetical protein